MEKYPPRLITINEISSLKQMYTTLGDWWYGSPVRTLLTKDTDTLQIAITNIQHYDRRYFWPILFHELIEVAWCAVRGIDQMACHRFDELWEDELRRGLHEPTDEAGLDKRCPYRGGHKWGLRFERLVCWVLGINWRTYCADCDASLVFKQPTKLTGCGEVT